MNVLPVWVKPVAMLILVGTLVAFGWYIKGTIEENRQLRAQQKEILTRLDKEEKKNERQDELFLQREAAQNEVRAGVADVTVRIKQEESHDPPTASFNRTILPAGLRRAVLEAAAARASAKGEGASSGDKDRREVPGQRSTNEGPN